MERAHAKQRGTCNLVAKIFPPNTKLKNTKEKGTKQPLSTSQDAGTMTISVPLSNFTFGYLYSFLEKTKNGKIKSILSVLNSCSKLSILIAMLTRSSNHTLKSNHHATRAIDLEK